MHTARLAAVACTIWSMACASALVRPAVAPATPVADALLVLPGLGYDGGGERVFRALAPSMTAAGVDLYLPTCISRSGLDGSRACLQRFVRENRLARYERVHVFAFLAGGWAFNPLAEAGALPNLSTVVYDRSPYQERAPGIAREALPLLAWLRYGRVVFDLARTPYAPLTAPGVRVGLMIETQPTAFIRRFATAADRRGPYRFGCDAFGQPYDDCLYMAMSHDELYGRFAELWPEVRSFILTGHFTAGAGRMPPDPALATRSRR
jgi:hypothetical protein